MKWGLLMVDCLLLMVERKQDKKQEECKSSSKCVSTLGERVRKKSEVCQRSLYPLLMVSQDGILDAQARTPLTLGTVLSDPRYDSVQGVVCPPAPTTCSVASLPGL